MPKYDKQTKEVRKAMLTVYTLIGQSALQEGSTLVSRTSLINNLKAAGLLPEDAQTDLGTIKIFIRGGVCYAVEGVPEGFDYQIIDED